MTSNQYTAHALQSAIELLEAIENNISYRCIDGDSEERPLIFMQYIADELEQLKHDLKYFIGDKQ